jgi:hypothetical protein
MNDPQTAQLQAIAEAGVAQLRAGNNAAARASFTEIVGSGRATPQVWMFLAQACERLKDDAAAHEACDRVLAEDRINPYAMALKGDLYARSGDDRAAGSWYSMALQAAEGVAEPPADLPRRMAQVAAARAVVAERFLGHLKAAMPDPAAAGPRVAEAMRILSGETQPYFSQPTNFFFPGLPHRAWFDPAEFDWARQLADAYPAIRDEALAVLNDPDGVAPYVQPDPDRPARAHALLNDPRWSAFHLFEGGKPVPERAARCPATMAALSACPLPQVAGRAPMALFSILKGGTHIPPHNGMLNTRLICHLPLIVPPGCRLRVGSETRTVEAGKVLLFDDSMEHEAWNDSRETRVILLFEVWRPELTEGEKTALTGIFSAVDSYGEG